MKIIEAAYIRGSEKLPEAQRYQWVQCFHCGEPCGKLLMIDKDQYCEECLGTLIDLGLEKFQELQKLEAQTYLESL